MNEIQKLTAALLKSELCGDPLPPLPQPLDAGTAAQLYSLSAAHDLAHMVGSALRRAGCLPKQGGSDPFGRMQILAVCRCEQLKYELNAITTTLNAAGIPHIPLKGAILRPLYPAPEMRTSGDIDLLVGESSADAAASALTSSLGYQKVRRGSHDILLTAPSGVHLELHFVLPETGSPAIARELADLWKTAIPDPALPCRLSMTPEHFAFYHYAHMARHFREGGCGIRFFMDLWIMEKKLPADPVILEGMLSRAGLLAFAGEAKKLAGSWFGSDPMTAESEELADFVFGSGVYGSTANRVRIKRLEKNSSGYLLSRIFLPFDDLKYQFPYLQKCPLLLPAAEVHRWLRLASGSTAARIKGELQINRTLTPETENRVRALMKRLGL